MAYGQLAGLSPVNGLYALLLPTVAYVLLGSSRRLVIGPEGATTLVAAAVLPLAIAGSDDAAELASMLALLVAACFLLARVLRLGWIADYFSRPVLIGYLHGVAVTLVIAQLGKPGLEVDASESLDRLWEVLQELGDVSGVTLAVSVASLGAMFGLRRFLPIVPGALIVVVAAITLSWLFDFASHGVAVVGPVPGGLPRPTLPTPPLSDVLALAPAALGLFLVSFADEILTARAFAGKRREHVRASQELLTMGAANAAAGFTQGFSVGERCTNRGERRGRCAYPGRWPVLRRRDRVVLLFLTQPVQYLPQAVLGAVIVAAGINIVEPAAWRASRRSTESRSRSPAPPPCVVLRRARGARRRRRALDHRHGASQRSPRDVLGGPTPRGLPRRRASPISSGHAGRCRLPTRRPASSQTQYVKAACARRSGPRPPRPRGSCSTRKQSATSTRPGWRRSSTWT